MTLRKHTPEHDYWHPRVEGQIRVLPGLSSQGVHPHVLECLAHPAQLIVSAPRCCQRRGGRLDRCRAKLGAVRVRPAIVFRQ